jgi:hypothetical protein
MKLLNGSKLIKTKIIIQKSYKASVRKKKPSRLFPAIMLTQILIPNGISISTFVWEPQEVFSAAQEINTKLS